MPPTPAKRPATRSDPTETRLQRRSFSPPASVATGLNGGLDGVGGDRRILVLPEAEHRPPHLFELGVGRPDPGLVRRQLGHPPGSVRVGDRPVYRAGVPEAAVDEDDDLEAGGRASTIRVPRPRRTLLRPRRSAAWFPARCATSSVPPPRATGPSAGSGSGHPGLLLERSERSRVVRGWPGGIHLGA